MQASSSLGGVSNFRLYSQRPSSLTSVVHTATSSDQEGALPKTKQPASTSASTDVEVRADADVRTNAESSDFVGSTLAQALNASPSCPSSVTIPARSL